MILTASGGAVAVFAAGGPGENVIAKNGADLLVGIAQTQESVSWTSFAGNVSIVETLGWSSSDGVHELGGALVIETPPNPTAGMVDIGEKPKSMVFRFAD